MRGLGVTRGPTNRSIPANAKIVGGLGVTFLCASIISMFVMPALIRMDLEAADDYSSDHVDSSMIYFQPGIEEPVLVESLGLARNLPWSVWHAATEDCDTRFNTISVAGPLPPAMQGVVDVRNDCNTTPTLVETVAAHEHLPALSKVATFFPLSSPLEQATVVGTYTVSCGVEPCWVVDEAAAMDVDRYDSLKAAEDPIMSGYLIVLGVMFGGVGSILLCISCFLVAMGPDEKRGLLVAGSHIEEGDEEDE